MNLNVTLMSIRFKLSGISEIYFLTDIPSNLNEKYSSQCLYCKMCIIIREKFTGVFNFGCRNVCIELG